MVKGQRCLSIQDEEYIIQNTQLTNWKSARELGKELGVLTTVISSYRNVHNLSKCPPTINNENLKIFKNYSTPENWLSSKELALKLNVSTQSIVILRAKLQIKMICPNCKEEFIYGYTKAKTKRKHIYNDPKFCSSDCFKEYMKKGFSKECPVCHIMFTGRKYFCSNICKSKEKERLNQIKLNQKIEKSKHICPECKIEFIKKGRGIFCSKACYLKNYKLKEIKDICKECGKEFSHTGLSKKNFCSSKCWGDYASKKSQEQGNLNFTSRSFALFILTLRKSNREVYLKTLDEIRNTLSKEDHDAFYDKFHRVLNKYKESLNINNLNFY